MKFSKTLFFLALLILAIISVSDAKKTVTKSKSPIKHKSPIKSKKPAKKPAKVEFDLAKANKRAKTYLSCKPKDWKCQAKMSDKCYKDVRDCFRAKKGNKTCHKINSVCKKIWKKSKKN